MSAIGPSLVVDKNTTREALLSYIDTHTNSGDRIVGKYDKATDTTLLYAKTNSASLIDRLTGRAADRRADAREAVITVFKNYDTDLSQGGLSTGGTSVRKFLFAKISERMNAHDTSALRSGEVRKALVDAGTIGAALPKADPVAPPAPPPGEPGGPTLARTGLTAQTFTTLAANLTSVAAVTVQTDSADPTSTRTLSPGARQIAETLGDTIATSFAQTHRLDASKERFALSNGVTLRTQIVDAIKTTFASLPATTPPRTMPEDADLHRIATFAFDRAAAQLSPDKVVPNETKTIPATATGTGTVTLPKITIKGQEFEPVRFLGLGGFAQVFEYKATTGDARIAFKIPNDTGGNRAVLDAVNTEVAREVDTHRAVQGDGHRNIIGMEGAVRLPDGRIGIALELAPGGDVHDMQDKIASAIGSGPGKITQAQADMVRLTLIKDMAEGLKHLRGNDMIHFDFKTPNVMIGGDGRAKVADFGMTRGESGIRAVDAPKVDNPRYQAPELLYAKDHIRLTDQRVKKDMKALDKAIKADVRDAFPNAKPDQIKDVFRHMRVPVEQNAKDLAEIANAQLTMTNAGDTWALGVAAANLFIGDFDPGGDGSFLSRMEVALLDFGADGTRLALASNPNGTRADGALAQATHSEPVTAFINELMGANPDTRPSFDAILGRSILTDRGVGSDQAHLLVAALASGNTADIDYAKGRLQGFTMLGMARSS